MPREISGLRLSRSFITPTDTRVSREIDFQLGARQGIAIHGVLGEIMVDPNNVTVNAAVIDYFAGNHTLHLETGSLETVPDAAGEDEDTIDSEIFFRQGIFFGGNDDVTTEFRASLAIQGVPGEMIAFPRPIFTARNITHSGITTISNMDILCHVIIYYVFVEFSLAELGLILARRQ